MTIGTHDLPRAAAAAVGLRAVDAARRAGRLPQGRRPDRRRWPTSSPARTSSRPASAPARCRCRCCARSARAGGCRRTSGAQDFAEIARANVERFFGGAAPGLEHHRRRRCRTLLRPRRDVDRVVLDMLAPWECLDAVVAGAAARRGGLLLRRHDHPAVHARSRRCAAHGTFTEPQSWESMVARLARRGPRRAPGAPDDRPHRLPVHHPAAGRRRRAAAAPAPAEQGRVRRARRRVAPARQDRARSAPTCPRRPPRPAAQPARPAGATGGRHADGSRGPRLAAAGPVGDAGCSRRGTRYAESITAGDRVVLGTATVSPWPPAGSSPSVALDVGAARRCRTRRPRRAYCDARARHPCTGPGRRARRELHGRTLGAPDRPVVPDVTHPTYIGCGQGTDPLGRRMVSERGRSARERSGDDASRSAAQAAELQAQVELPRAGGLGPAPQAGRLAAPGAGARGAAGRGAGQSLAGAQRAERPAGRHPARRRATRSSRSRRRSSGSPSRRAATASS